MREDTLMNDETMSEILKKNPQVNKDLLRKALDILRQMDAAGVKSNAISAMPPVDPYSGITRRHGLGYDKHAKSQPNKPRLHPSSLP